MWRIERTPARTAEPGRAGEEAGEQAGDEAEPGREVAPLKGQTYEAAEEEEDAAGSVDNVAPGGHLHLGRHPPAQEVHQPHRDLQQKQDAHRHHIIRN